MDAAISIFLIFHASPSSLGPAAKKHSIPDRSRAPPRAYAAAARSVRLVGVGAATADRANVEHGRAVGGKNQRWKVVSTGDGYKELVPQHSGKCLEVKAQSIADRANCSSPLS